MMIKAHIANLLTQKHYIHLLRWKLVNGDNTKRLDYDLDETSTVLDVGGYRGEWCSAIHSRYQCKVLSFEPVPEFFEALLRDNESNAGVRAYNFGLGAADSTQKISLSQNASSVHRASDDGINIEIRDIISFLDEHDIQNIDLMKLNVEGAEYDILERLIDTGYINRVEQMQIQFHDFVDDASIRRSDLIKALRVSHRRDWNYPFIWEGWTRL